jgi:hypothetical protein
MLVNIIKSYRDIVAVCDKELLGKRFEEGQFQLDVKESFFGGNEISVEELIYLMQDMSKEDATFNLVGEKTIDTAIKAGIISGDGVGEIAGIPFALVLL